MLLIKKYSNTYHECIHRPLDMSDCFPTTCGITVRCCWSTINTKRLEISCPLLGCHHPAQSTEWRELIKSTWGFIHFMLFPKPVWPIRLLWVLCPIKNTTLSLDIEIDIWMCLVTSQDSLFTCILIAKHQYLITVINTA